MTCLHGTGRAYFTALAAVLGQLGDQTIGRKTARPRHFDLAQTASLAKITTAIKLKHGTFYDDIANGNSYYPNSTATPGNDDQRLAQIQNLASGGANISTFGYAYNAAGLITSWSKQVGTGSTLTSTFLYDTADQLISATLPSDSAVASRAYAYDQAGNRTREQVDVTTSAFSFNTVNQLTAQSAGGDLAFTGTVNEPATLTVGGNAATVDAAGLWVGRAAVTIGANSIPLVATDLNGNVTSKTISVTVAGGTARTLTYDLNGNLTDNGAGQTYAWDAANRLISITQGSNVTAFVYNGLGQRVQEKLNGTVIKQWVWNGGAQPAEERDGSNAVTKRFYGLGEQIGGVAYFFTADHLGSIREMVDSAGLIRARYDYDPYGRITKVSGDLEADFGFTGFYRHQASGLNLTLYRAYDPELGRWLSRDPIGEDGGINLYAYVRNDPMNSVDPLGLYISPIHFWETYFAEVAHGHILQAGFVAWESVMTDFRGTQGTSPEQTHIHAMSGKVPGRDCNNGYETREEAKSDTKEYVQEQLQDYAQAHKWWLPWSGASYLGNAYHATEDSYAGGHNYQPWQGGFPGLGHLFWDLVPNPSSMGGAYQVRNGGGLSP